MNSCWKKANEPSSIRDHRKRGKVGRNAEHGVECVRLRAGLRRLAIGSGGRARARCLGCRVRATRVRQGVADELSDDVDVLSRAVVEGF